MNPRILLDSAGFDGMFPSRTPCKGGSPIAAGVAFGTVVWFVFICTAAALFHRKVGDVFLNRARAGVGGLFVVIAILSAASVLMVE